jgi:hypothetical protein
MSVSPSRGVAKVTVWPSVLSVTLSASVTVPGLNTTETMLALIPAVCVVSLSTAA